MPRRRARAAPRHLPQRSPRLSSCHWLSSSWVFLFVSVSVFCVCSSVWPPGPLFNWVGKTQRRRAQLCTSCAYNRHSLGRGFAGWEEVLRFGTTLRGSSPLGFGLGKNKPIKFCGPGWGFAFLGRGFAVWGEVLRLRFTRFWVW